MLRWLRSALRETARADGTGLTVRPGEAGQGNREELSKLRTELEERARLLQLVQMGADWRLERIHQLEAHLSHLRAEGAEGTRRLQDELLAMRAALADRERQIAELRAELDGLRAAQGAQG